MGCKNDTMFENDMILRNNILLENNIILEKNNGRIRLYDKKKIQWTRRLEVVA